MRLPLVITVVPMGITETDEECPECFRSLHRFTWAVGARLGSALVCVEHGTMPPVDTPQA